MEIAWIVDRSYCPETSKMYLEVVYMKNYKSRIIIMVVMLLVASFLVMSCGGSGPRDLARQHYNLVTQNPNVNSEKYRKKLDTLTTKILNLSKKDKEVYNEEYQALIWAGRK
jgi:hypothetical protein